MFRKFFLFAAIFLLVVMFYVKNEKQKGVDVVNVYSSRKEVLTKPFFEEFTKLTGIKINLVADSDPGKLITRVESEGREVNADVLMTADVANLIFAQEKGILQPVNSDILNKSVPKNLHNDYWFGVTMRARVIAYSKDRVDSNKIRDYSDLASSGECRRRLVMRSSNSVYNQSLVAAIIANENKKAGVDFVKGIVKNMVRKPQGGDTDQIRAIANGVGDCSVVNSYYYARLMHSEDEGDRGLVEKVGVIFPGEKSKHGTHVNISGISLVAGAKHKDNAVKFMEFLVSEKAQNMYTEINQEYPILAGVEPSDNLKKLGDFRVDDIPLEKVAQHVRDAVIIADEYGWR